MQGQSTRWTGPMLWPNEDSDENKRIHVKKITPLQNFADICVKMSYNSWFREFAPHWKNTFFAEMGTTMDVRFGRDGVRTYAIVIHRNNTELNSNQWHWTRRPYLSCALLNGEWHEIRFLHHTQMDPSNLLKEPDCVWISNRLIGANIPQVSYLHNKSS